LRFVEFGQEEMTQCDESIDREIICGAWVDCHLVVNLLDANGVRGRPADSYSHTRRDVSMNEGIAYVSESIDIGHRIRGPDPVPLCRTQTVHRSRSQLAKIWLALRTSCQIRKSCGSQVDRGHRGRHGELESTEIYELVVLVQSRTD